MSSDLSPQDQAEVQAEGERFYALGRLIATGNLADLSQESREWYVGRAADFRRALERLDREGSPQRSAVRTLVPGLGL